MVAGATLGWRPKDTHKATLPELLLAIDGWRQARGIKAPVPAMTRARLNELAGKYQ